MVIRDIGGAFDAGPLRLRDAALFTDLYELTMAAAFFRHGIRGPATFSLFVRRLPETRAFLVAGGWRTRSTSSTRCASRPARWRTSARSDCSRTPSSSGW